MTPAAPAAPAPTPTVLHHHLHQCYTSVTPAPATPKLFTCSVLRPPPSLRAYEAAWREEDEEVEEEVAEEDVEDEDEDAFTHV